ncbi:MAG: UvrD-helicase domain-containing protein, partial [Tissierellales bacterium]|nr:UvrD-helicase domain-containing protein [Tissierellales bacterium]
LIKRLDTDISGKYNIRKQIYLLNISSISTIHAFCTKIIRKYYYFLDIDPNFSISSIEENEILFNEALEEVLEKSYEDNSIEFQTLVDNYSETRGDSMLEKLIKDTYSSIQSFSYPLKWLEESVDLLRDDDSENLWLKIIKEDIYKLLLSTISLLSSTVLLL